MGGNSGSVPLFCPVGYGGLCNRLLLIRCRFFSMEFDGYVTRAGHCYFKIGGGGASVASQAVNSSTCRIPSPRQSRMIQLERFRAIIANHLSRARGAVRIATQTIQPSEFAFNVARRLRRQLCYVCFASSQHCIYLAGMLDTADCYVNRQRHTLFTYWGLFFFDTTHCALGRC